MRSSSDSSIAVPSVPAAAPIGAQSRPLRFLIATLVVGVYIALGLVLHLTGAQYELLGIPIVVGFQLGIQRQPLRTLWVRMGQPRLDAWFFSLWALFSLVPLYAILVSARSGNLWNAMVGLAALVGAFGLAYSLRAIRPANVRQLVLCILTAGGIGILLVLLSMALPSVVHMGHGRSGAPAGRLPAFPSGLELGLVNFLILWPGFFVVEEVFFRGALDTYLHRGEQGVGWVSAIFVSALWGLWHLPAQSATALSGAHLASTIVGLLVAQIAGGVPLSYWWRKSGNLIVTDTTHALVDTIRNVVLSASVF